jgi:hypothetical protein
MNRAGEQVVIPKEVLAIAVRLRFIDYKLGFARAIDFGASQDDGE